MIEEPNVVLFVSTYPPRECGIATFTQDISSAVEKKFYPHLVSKILAMNSNSVNIYNYPKKEIYQLSDSERKSYKKLAQKINEDPSIKIVVVQHEFGIFGGHFGEYLLDLLKNIDKPKILNFHSILPKPEPKRKNLLKNLAENVDEFLVMTQAGVEILRKTYEIKIPIRVIPHGIPTVEYESQKKAKEDLGFAGKIILSSFGMMSINKGYEYVIEALPEVVKKYPNLLYIIVGATHPNVRKHEGERYRNFLARKVKERELQRNVKFYNKYVPLDEIIHYLKATDIYICSSLTPEQITSGTLAYAMGCGRAAISTPFLHAKDLITPDRGRLTSGFKDSEGFKNALLELLSNKEKIKNMEETAYEFTRHMTWPNVALAYGETIKKYLPIPETFFEVLPEINIEHIKKMTDDFGIIQFARYASPNPNSGYTLDDNSRALEVVSQLYTKTQDPKYINLARIYLNYLNHVQDRSGRFLNFVSRFRKINLKSLEEEAHARAVQALGILISLQTIPKEIKKQAEELFFRSLPVSIKIESPRPAASIIKGLYHYNKEFYSESTINKIDKLAETLISIYDHNVEQGWEWFEKELTYANSKLPEALLYAYMTTRKNRYIEIASQSLRFLMSKTFEDNMFIPIGQNGWYKKGKERPYYDQQPIEVDSMVSTLALAYKLTRNPIYEKKALIAFQWFLGRNTLKQVIYNEKTGGCLDGLDEQNANLNQGAESTLAYLNARLVMGDLI